MRLKERTLTEVRLAPRMNARGSLGGMREEFSPDTIPLRASVLPEKGGLDVRQRGAVNRAALRLLVPVDVSAACGDGVWVNGALWRIAEVRPWTAHTEWICEAVS